MVQWNGDNGEVYFFQSELPYDVKQEYGDQYVGFRVNDSATKFSGYGIGVYSFFRDYEVYQANAIKTPLSDGIHLKNSFILFLSGNGGINHIADGEGNGVKNGGGQGSYLCSLSTDAESESFTRTNLSSTLFLQ